MAFIVLTDCKIYAGGYHISSYSNEAALTLTPNILENTTFGQTTKRNQAGMFDFKANIAGYMDNIFPMGAPPLDQNNSFNSALFAKIGATLDVLTLAPVGNAEQDIAHFTQSVWSKFDPIGGAVGALLPYKMEASATGIKSVRGYAMAVGLKTTTGNSAAGVNIVGGVAAGQSLYAALHVVGISGTTPTLNVIVRSAAASNMASPTTRITFPQYTTAYGASWGTSVPGPITDAFFDMQWTIAGTTPNYVVFGVLGVI